MTLLVQTIRYYDIKISGSEGFGRFELNARLSETGDFSYITWTINGLEAVVEFETSRPTIQYDTWSPGISLLCNPTGSASSGSVVLKLDDLKYEVKDPSKTLTFANLGKYISEGKVSSFINVQWIHDGIGSYCNLTSTKIFESSYPYPPPPTGVRIAS